MERRISVLSWCLVSLLCCAAPALARPWLGTADPAPARPAQYYSMIVDTHKSDEIVMVVWLSAPYVGAAIEKMPGMQEALDKYVVIGVVRVRREGNKILLDYGPAAKPSDQDDNPLVRVRGPKVPENIKKLVAITKMGWAAAARSGPSGGQGDILNYATKFYATKFRFLAFESGNVRACGKGQLRVRYAGETYTYDTPIPGCPGP